MLANRLPMTARRAVMPGPRLATTGGLEWFAQFDPANEIAELFDANEIRVRLITTPHRSDWPQEFAELSRCLSPIEQATLATLRSPIRQRQFLLGRQEAKRLIAEQFSDNSISWPQISIESRDLSGAGQRPVIRISRRRLPWSLSLSHAAESVLVATAKRPNVRLGVDVTMISEVRPKALGAWLTDSERDQFDVNDPRDLAVCWSLKEAVYKATQRGESFRPRSVNVDRVGDHFRCRFNQSELPDTSDICVWHRPEFVAVLVRLPGASVLTFGP